jgi:hypothetical protein
MTKIVELIITDESKENIDGVFAISLVEDPAMEEHWIALNKQKPKIKIECAKIDEDKRLLIAPALIPDKQIFRVDENGSDFYVWFSRPTIKKASELFLQRSHHQDATLEHANSVKGISVVESWVKEFEIDKSVKYGFEHLPVGTWFVSMKIENDEIWKMVKEGVVKGFSIEGYFTDKMQQMSSKSEEEEAILEQMRGIIRGECAK